MHRYSSPSYIRRPGSVQRIAETERFDEESEGQRVKLRILSNGGMILFRGQKPLLRHVPLASGVDLERRPRLYVAIPVCLLLSAGEHYAFSGSRVVEDDLQNRLLRETALTSLVG